MRALKYLSAGLLLTASIAGAQTAADHIALGDKEYVAMNATAALSHYEAAIKEDPQNYEALWKASRYRYFLAACLSQLGRASLRAGDLVEALKRLEEAKAHFVHVGAAEELPPVEAWIAECRVGMGDFDSALALVDGLLSRAGSSNGVAKVTARRRGPRRS